MPSPFPGMDPYLEAQHVWPGFHHALASEIHTQLNQSLPAPYYAALEARMNLGIVADDRESWRAIVPDIARLDPRRRPDNGGGTAVIERPRQVVSRRVEIETAGEPTRHFFVEVRDAKREHKLITLIEVLSPLNKRPGPDRAAYAVKQRDVLDSETSLVEIDLLRAGERVTPNPVVAAFLDRLNPAPDYLVLVSPAWRRIEPGWGYHVFPVGLREWLPCIGIPLAQEDAELPLDLQYVFNRVYDGGPYRRGAVDYRKRPDPPLSEADATWAESLQDR